MLPGARPGGGPGGPPKIRTSRRIPRLRWSNEARTPDSAPAGTERRKTAAAWETDRLTSPFCTFNRRILSISRVFSRTFPEKGGHRGATGRKSARDLEKTKENPETFPPEEENPEEFSGQTGTPGTFPPGSRGAAGKKSRGGRVRRDFSRISRKNSGNPPRRRDFPAKNEKNWIFHAPGRPARGRARGPAKNPNFPPDSPTSLEQ